MHRIWIFGVLCAAAGYSQADVVQSPVSISSPQGEHHIFLLDYIIDQSGLSEQYTSGATEFETYVGSATHRPFNDVLRPLIFGSTNTVDNGPQQFTFDFGKEVQLSQIAIWVPDLSYAISSFELFADDDDDYLNGTSKRLLDPMPLESNHPDLDEPITAQEFSFAPTYTRYVHINGLSSLEPPDAYALAEVVFGVVPAPSSVVLFYIAAAGITTRRF